MIRPLAVGLSNPKEVRAASRRAGRVAWAGVLAGVLCAVVWAGVLASIFSYRARRPDFPAITEVADRSSAEVAELLHEARETLVRLAEEFPDTPETYEALAAAHFHLDLPDEAIRFAQKCLELDPRFGMAHHWLGVVARQKGHHAEAAEHFRRAMELGTESPGLVVDLADALTKAGRPEEAIPILVEDLRLRPGSISTLLVLGETYSRCKRYAEARSTLEKAVQAAPDYTTAYLALATACARLGDEAKSKEYLQRFKKLKDRDEQIHRESLKAPDPLAEVRWDVAQTRLGAARVYLLHGRLGPAEENLLRACELAPKLWDCRQLLAWLHEQQGRTDEAVRTLADFTAAVPDDPKGHMFLGALLGRLGRVDQAAASYRKAIALAPAQAMGYAALADLYLTAGPPDKLAEAKASAQKAADLQPVARHFFLLAMACRLMGDGPGARSAIDRAVELEPQNSEYRQAQASLRADGRR